ncbi:hypothetical protein PAPYR_3192 [Paratrimastix pyriformis]|uniref:Calponin-homology (CH) domain-containing protein n=1 Tax=Paratrimastix pyriformis TaxID=342808 RepID=A0ABQ8UUY8_9EUKA|nr:hypothetical protein PAPYR_3192 [Paratrimastix pyriformis]
MVAELIKHPVPGITQSPRSASDCIFNIQHAIEALQEQWQSRGGIPSVFLDPSVPERIYKDDRALIWKLVSFLRHSFEADSGSAADLQRQPAERAPSRSRAFQRMAAGEATPSQPTRAAEIATGRSASAQRASQGRPPSAGRGGRSATPSTAHPTTAGRPQTPTTARPQTPTTARPQTPSVAPSVTSSKALLSHMVDPKDLRPASPAPPPRAQTPVASSVLPRAGSRPRTATPAAPAAPSISTPSLLSFRPATAAPTTATTGGRKERPGKERLFLTVAQEEYLQWLATMGIRIEPPEQQPAPAPASGRPPSRSRASVEGPPPATPLDAAQVAEAFRTGVALCKLVGALEGTAVVGMEPNPRSGAAMVANINKALAVLRERKRMNHRFLFDPEPILRGDVATVWGLLEDINKEYGCPVGTKKLKLNIGLDSRAGALRASVPAAEGTIPGSAQAPPPAHEIDAIAAAAAVAEGGRAQLIRVTPSMEEEVRAWLHQLRFEVLDREEHEHWTSDPFRNGLLLGDLVATLFDTPLRLHRCPKVIQQARENVMESLATLRRTNMVPTGYLWDPDGLIKVRPPPQPLLAPWVPMGNVVPPGLTNQACSTPLMPLGLGNRELLWGMLWHLKVAHQEGRIEGPNVQTLDPHFYYPPPTPAGTGGCPTGRVLGVASGSGIPGGLAPGGLNGGANRPGGVGFDNNIKLVSSGGIAYVPPLPYSGAQLRELEVTRQPPPFSSPGPHRLATFGLADRVDVLAGGPGGAPSNRLREIMTDLRNGTLLCDLVAVMQSEKSNIVKALDILRKRRAMSQRYVWCEDEILHGDRNAILGLLEDMHRCYDGLPPRPSAPTPPPGHKRSPQPPESPYLGRHSAGSAAGRAEGLAATMPARPPAAQAGPRPPQLGPAQRFPGAHGPRGRASSLTRAATSTPLGSFAPHPLAASARPPHHRADPFMGGPGSPRSLHEGPDAVAAFHPAASGWSSATPRALSQSQLLVGGTPGAAAPAPAPAAPHTTVIPMSSSRATSVTRFQSLAAAAAGAASTANAPGAEAAMTTPGLSGPPSARLSASVPPGAGAGAGVSRPGFLSPRVFTSLPPGEEGPMGPPPGGLAASPSSYSLRSERFEKASLAGSASLRRPLSAHSLAAPESLVPGARAGPGTVLSATTSAAPRRGPATILSRTASSPTELKAGFPSPVRLASPSQHAAPPLTHRAGSGHPDLISPFSRACLLSPSAFSLLQGQAPSTGYLLAKWVQGLGVKIPSPFFLDVSVIPEIVGALEHHEIEGVTKAPKSTASFLHNTRKALEVLRKKKNMPMQHLYSEEDIMRGNSIVILSLLEQMRRAYGHALPKPSATATSTRLAATTAISNPGMPPTPHFQFNGTATSTSLRATLGPAGQTTPRGTQRW